MSCCPDPPEGPAPSAFSAAFLSASRFFARAVVDSTAVGIFTATLFDSAVTGFGYANSDGLHLHTTCAVPARRVNPHPFMCMSH